MFQTTNQYLYIYIIILIVDIPYKYPMIHEVFHHFSPSPLIKLQFVDHLLNLFHVPRIQNTIIRSSAHNLSLKDVSSCVLTCWLTSVCKLLPVLAP